MGGFLQLAGLSDVWTLTPTQLTLPSLPHQVDDSIPAAHAYRAYDDAVRSTHHYQSQPWTFRPPLRREPALRPNTAAMPPPPPLRATSNHHSHSLAIVPYPRWSSSYDDRCSASYFTAQTYVPSWHTQIITRRSEDSDQCYLTQASVGAFRVKGSDLGLGLGLWVSSGSGTSDSTVTVHKPSVISARAHVL